MLSFFMVFLFWLASIIRVNILTLNHVSEFSVPEETLYWLGIDENFKVIKYDDSYAEIYNRGGYGGFVFKFIRVGTLWEMETGQAIWATSGSINDFIWPYIYHSETGIGMIFFVISIAFFYALIKLFKILISKDMI